jgi:hypothetical protein
MPIKLMDCSVLTQHLVVGRKYKQYRLLKKARKHFEFYVRYVILSANRVFKEGSFARAEFIYY